MPAFQRNLFIALFHATPLLSPPRAAGLELLADLARTVYSRTRKVEAELVVSALLCSSLELLRRSTLETAGFWVKRAVCEDFSSSSSQDKNAWSSATSTCTYPWRESY